MGYTRSVDCKDTISPDITTYCAIISPLLYHFSTCISPDLAFTTHIFLLRTWTKNILFKIVCNDVKLRIGGRAAEEED